ncbi:MAG: putative 4-hydroxybenzoate polyprenyltransferase [Desulfovibrio sp.]|jgi:4-hydroxybenzoate polyprenyltransferase|nr:putative 4-hydroxybenzoate polyprenyltransferase [Desulfovibrio sp.]
MRTPFGSVADLCRMVKIEHSIFALPYAWAGMLLATRSLPPVWPFVFLTLAMVAVRSYAMAFNRLADLSLDSRNPRTRDRPLVTGAITVASARWFCIAMAAIFIAACACLNDLCLYLSVPALVFASVYSYVKRISSVCHFWLGATLGLAPLAGWISVTPTSMTVTPLLLSLVVTFWVGAFDIFYAFLDIDFDRKEGVHSLPADRGEEAALSVAAFAHAVTVLLLALTGFSAGLSWPWYAMCGIVTALLVLEHFAMRRRDPRHVNMAFFTLNGFVSPLVLVGVALGLWW